MSAGERLARLLALVPWLSTREGVTVDEAARTFGIDPGTLERDLWLVVCCGLPGHGPDQLIDIDFWDEGGRIRVIDPQTLVRPVRLTRDEIVALLLGLRLLSQVPGDHDQGAIASATALLEDAARGLGLDPGTDDTAAASAVAIDAGAREQHREALDEALREGRAIRLSYIGAARDSLTERIVDPERVRVAEGRAYLEGWCRSAGARRSFRLDRSVDVAVLDEPAVPPEPSGGEGSAAPAPGTAGTSMTLRLSPAARWMLDVHRMTLLEELPEGWCRAALPVSDPDWGIRLVLGQGGRAVLEEPAAWVDLLRSAAAAGVRRHA